MKNYNLKFKNKKNKNFALCTLHFDFDDRREERG